MHEAPEAQRDPFSSHVCAAQADNPDQLHAMLGGLSSIKTAALLNRTREATACDYDNE